MGDGFDVLMLQDRSLSDELVRGGLLLVLERSMLRANPSHQQAMGGTILTVAIAGVMNADRATLDRIVNRLVKIKQAQPYEVEEMERENTAMILKCLDRFKVWFTQKEATNQDETSYGDPFNRRRFS